MHNNITDELRNAAIQYLVCEWLVWFYSVSYFG